MKVTDLRRKLLAALAAGGMLAPARSRCCTADLNTNLVVNADFENVDINSTGGLRSVKILDWNSGTKMAFAYSHDGSLNGAGGIIPDYANGGPLAGGGHFYFTSNATPAPNQTSPGQASFRRISTYRPANRRRYRSGQCRVQSGAFSSAAT